MLSYDISYCQIQLVKKVHKGIIFVFYIRCYKKLKFTIIKIAKNYDREKRVTAERARAGSGASRRWVAPGPRTSC